MSEDIPTTDDSPTSGRRRGLVAAAAAVVGIVAVGVISLPESDLSPTTTLVETSITSPSTTTTTTTVTTPTAAVPSTSLAAFTAEFSPFAQQNLVSSLNSIPENPAVADAATSIYVDPVGGDDRSVGTVDSPVATLEAAKRLARQALSDSSGVVVVYLRGGVHARVQPFTLSFQDSGRDGSDMVYRSYPGEQAIIEGGVRIDGWETAYDSVMVAAVPDSISDMRQLFAAGQRQQRARTADAVGTAKEFVQGPLFGRQRNVAMTVDADLVDGFATVESLELVYVGVAVAGHGQTLSSGAERQRPSWKAHRLPVDSATPLEGGLVRLDIGGGALHHASERGYAPLEILPSDPFFIENAIELLDEPGEWYFDESARLLYWWPPNAAATANAWVPVTEVLLNIDGTPDRPVRNVRFEGIAFRHSSYTITNQTGSVVSQAANWFTGWRTAEWMEHAGQRHPHLDGDRFPNLPGAAIQVDSARDISFTGNVFTELGAVAVMVHNDVIRATFDGNLFVDIGAAALVAGHPVHDEIDEPMEGPITDLVFTNNVVDRAAAEYYASVGVQITKANGATVSHNLFRDLPYSAMSLGWGWEDNQASTVHRAIEVENNYFEDVVNLLYDGAPIYVLGPVAEPGAARRDFTQIRGNFINNADAAAQFKALSDLVDPVFAKRPGIQLDKGTRNILVVDNAFAGTTRWLQVTAWRVNQAVPGWAEDLTLIGRDNWSDTAAAEPGDTSLVGIEVVRPFSAEDMPTAVLAIIADAGLEPGVVMPPLPG